MYWQRNADRGQYGVVRKATWNDLTVAVKSFYPDKRTGFQEEVIPTHIHTLVRAQTHTVCYNARIYHVHKHTQTRARDARTHTHAHTHTHTMPIFIPIMTIPPLLKHS